MIGAKLLLVISIDSRSGAYRNATFRVVSVHYKLSAARKRAIEHRKNGYLARVQRKWGFWVLAVRRPRKRDPIRRDLIV